MVKSEKFGKILNGYEGLYQVSNLGRIRSLDKFININKNYSSIGYIKKGKIKDFYYDKDGYLGVSLWKNGKQKTYRVHRIVAQNFIDNIENKETVNHIDGNKENNNVKNLEWATYKENNLHAMRMGLNTKRGLKKRVKQYSKNNILINSFESLTNASLKTGVCISKISMCCNEKRKTAGGFIWKYE